MERPPKQPRRDKIPPEEREAYDQVVRRFRTMYGAGEAPPEEHFEVGVYFGALLNSPSMCAVASKLGAFFRGVGDRSGSYSHADREFVDQVLSADMKTNVVQSTHIPDSIRAGVRIGAIEALRYGREIDLNEDEKLLARYIRQTVTGTVDDETYRQIRQRLGDRGLVEYTGFILWLQWVMRMMQALNTGGPSDEEVDTLICRIKADTAHNR
jgi:hypothetical protein